MRYIGLVSALVLTSACGKSQPVPEPKESVLRSATGVDVGRVVLRERGGRILVQVRVAGLPPGDHGMHLHEVGRCEGPGFQSAGGHLNPGARMHHGHRNPQGPHLGDLGNIHVSENGRAEVTREVIGAEARTGLRTFLGEKGVALVLHATYDDEQTDPSGASGARIACAAIVP